VVRVTKTNPAVRVGKKPVRFTHKSSNPRGGKTGPRYADRWGKKPVSATQTGFVMSFKKTLSKDPAVRVDLVIVHLQQQCTKVMYYYY
jgi:hypothetical protein